MKTNLLSVRLSPDLARRLANLAKDTDRSKSYVAAQAIEEFLTLHEWQVAAIRKGLAEADAGELEPHEKALRKLRRWGRRGA
jgi:RHH-type rel operon transcriptional repressor/antitoxin RelB